jgi:tRNA(Arg) A34 adenosine deaminase TadA
VAQQVDFFSEALKQAREAAPLGEVPVGAVIVHDGRIIASAFNLVETLRDATAHAEILAIQRASQKLDSRHLTDCDLYVTLEPCAMCAAAISLARIRKVTFGAYDPKGGGVEHGPRFFQQPTCHHRPEIIGGIREAECSALLKDCFSKLREG